MSDGVDWTFLGLLETVRLQYPGYFEFLKTQPEVLRIYLDAAQNPTAWPPERINAAIANTAWFKTTPEDVRLFQMLSATDPASAGKAVQDVNQTVQRLVGSMGIHIDDTDKMLLTFNAAAQGWDESRLRIELIALSKQGLGFQPAGEVANTMTEFNNIAGQFGVPVTSEALWWWGSNAVAGNQSAETFASWARQQAINLYPALAPHLTQGGTVADYAEPYIADAVKELGINPAQIDLRNPVWMDLILTTNDKGEQAVRTRTEALTQIRSDERYGYDLGLPGRTEAARLSTQIMESFGALG